MKHNPEANDERFASGQDKPREGLANFCKGPGSNTSTFAGDMVSDATIGHCHGSMMRATDSKAHEWVWLCATKILFTKSGVESELACETPGLEGNK